MVMMMRRVVVVKEEKILVTSNSVWYMRVPGLLFACPWVHVIRSSQLFRDTSLET